MSKLFKKQFKPKNVIDFYLKKADKIKHDNIYNYAYTYCLKTPRGMLLDDSLNHKYGSSRKGFEQWKEDNPDLNATYNNNVSLRSIKHRSDYSRTVGYVLEEKLSDTPWQDEIKQLADECFEELCGSLNVVDKENFEYFVFNDVGGFEDYSHELIEKLRTMVHVFEEYQSNEEYRKLIDKIKG